MTEEVVSGGDMQQVGISILFSYVADWMIRMLTWFRPTETIQPAPPRSRSRPRPGGPGSFHRIPSLRGMAQGTPSLCRPTPGGGAPPCLASRSGRLSTHGHPHPPRRTLQPGGRGLPPEAAGRPVGGGDPAPRHRPARPGPAEPPER